MSIQSFNHIPKNIQYCPTCDTDTNQERAIDGYYYVCFTCGTKISDIERVTETRPDTFIVSPKVKQEIMKLQASTGASVGMMFEPNDPAETGYWQ